MPPHFAWTVIRRTYGFALKNAGPILAAIWMPILAAAAVLFISLYAYFHLLAAFLDAASMRKASLALAALAAGGFAWLLLYALAAAKLVCLAMGKHAPRAHRPATRLYAASLRFILLFNIFAIPLVVLMAAALRWGMGNSAILAVVAVLLLGSGWLTARMGLLLPALSVVEHGQVLRRSFVLTRHHQEQFLMLWFGLLFVPALVVQGIGELICAGISQPPAGDTAHLLSSAAITALMPFLPELIVIFSVSSTVCLILAAIGSAFIYDALVRPEPR